MTDNITLPREVAYEVPLHELLESVPLDARLVIDDADGKGTRFIPVGRACREAATALRAALAAPRQKPEPVAYFDLQKQVFFWAKPTMIDVPMTVALNPLPLYTAPPAAAPEPTHPGYVIGSHWLETAYSRVCAGEAEAEVLRDCGWERVDEALRRDAERLTDEQIDSATSKERDQLLDHIYEYGTAAEGILERIRKLARAAIDAAMGEKR
jgi:hypothetical protein